MIARHWARNARFRSAKTRVLLEFPSVDAGETWSGAMDFHRLVSGAHHYLPVTGGVHAIPAVEELRLHCLAAITPEALLGLDFGDCSLVYIDEHLNTSMTDQRKIRIYEMV